MVKGYSDRLSKLIKYLNELPGIGPKSAERIALFLMKEGRAQAEELAKSIVEASAHTLFCEECNNLSEKKICAVCEDPARDHSAICVVEDPKDVLSIEKTGGFNGLYHVLLGALSPLEGIGPRELKIDRFVKRVASRGV